MQIFEVVLLGVTQGLTEFLPVSSSGHLVLLRRLLDITEERALAFDAFLHLGTLAAVIGYYWQVWWGLVKGVVVRDKEKMEVVAKLIVATIPGALAGYWGAALIEDSFRSFGLLIGGFVLSGLVLLVDLLRPPQGTVTQVRWSDALLIGLGQVPALVPSVSRSGVTIAVGRGRGLSRKEAISFSFLLSAPIIAGASLLGLTEVLQAHTVPISLLFIGFLTSFGSGVMAITFIMRLIERISLLPFVIYLWVLSFVLWYVG